MQIANITLDIYSFLRSQDVADYCRQICHVFDLLEMAIIINRSEKTPMEKMAVYAIQEYTAVREECAAEKNELIDYWKKLTE